MSAGFYEKTDFLRVQDVTLAYRVPQRWLKKISLNRLEVYMNIKNLATWTSWTVSTRNLSATNSPLRRYVHSHSV